jgi:hypothetical protein
MNKILILATALTLLSCSKEVGSKGKKEDCDCDRVFKVEMSTLRIVPNGNGSANVYQCYNVSTVNDCSKFNDVKDFVEYEGRKVPEIGSCYSNSWSR